MEAVGLVYVAVDGLSVMKLRLPSELAMVSSGAGVGPRASVTKRPGFQCFRSEVNGSNYRLHAEKDAVMICPPMTVRFVMVRDRLSREHEIIFEVIATEDRDTVAQMFWRIERCIDGCTYYSVSTVVQIFRCAECG